MTHLFTVSFTCVRFFIQIENNLYENVINILRLRRRESEIQSILVINLENTTRWQIKMMNDKYRVQSVAEYFRAYRQSSMVFSWTKIRWHSTNVHCYFSMDKITNRAKQSAVVLDLSGLIQKKQKQRQYWILISNHGDGIKLIKTVSITKWIVKFCKKTHYVNV